MELVGGSDSIVFGEHRAIVIIIIIILIIDLFSSM